MIQNNEKSSILSVLFAVGFIVVVWVISNFTQIMSVPLIVLMCLLAEELAIIPNINKQYHEYNQVQPSFLRFVPIYNEIMLFNGVWYTLSFTLTGLLLLCSALATPVVITLIPVSAQLAVNITTYALFATIVTFVFICVVRGVGFLYIKNEIDMSILEIFDKTQGVTGRVLGFLLFIPLIRCIPLSYMWLDLKKLSLNAITYELSGTTEDNADYLTED